MASVHGVKYFYGRTEIVVWNVFVSVSQDFKFVILSFIFSYVAFNP